MVRQLGDVAGDARRYMRDVGIGSGLAAINVSERLAVGVFHFIAARNLLDRPRRREAAGTLWAHDAR